MRAEHPIAMRKAWMLLYGVLALVAATAAAGSTDLTPRTSNPDAGTATPTAAAPVRISFSPGTTSAEVSGNLAPQAVQSYLLDAAWDQVMIATAESADGKTILEITGQADGASLLAFSANAAACNVDLTWTQSYLVKVKNTGATASDYKLKVEIPARIYFRRGAYSGSVFGLGSAAKTLAYVLGARAGQTMTATISAPTPTVFLTVDGFRGGESLVKLSDGAISWTGALPQTQDYVVRATQNLAWVNFTLTVTIR